MEVVSDKWTVRVVILEFTVTWYWLTMTKVEKVCLWYEKHHQLFPQMLHSYLLGTLKACFVIDVFTPFETVWGDCLRNDL